MASAIRPGIRGKLGAYLALIRPIGWAPFLLPLLLGLIDAGFASLPTVYLMLLIFGPLLLGGTYILNFYTDVEVDRRSGVVKDLSMAGQPFVTGRVGRGEGLALAVILIVAGLALAYTVNLAVFWLGLGAVAIGIVYSFPPRLKDLPFGDIAANSLAAAICYASGWAAFGSLGSLPVYPVVWLCLLVAATYLLTVLIDLEPDREAGLRTTAVYLGVGRAFTFSFYLYALSVVFFILVLVFRFNWAYLLLAPGLVKGFASYRKRWQTRDTAGIYRLARRATMASVVAVAVLLVLYTILNLLGLTG